MQPTSAAGSVQDREGWPGLQVLGTKGALMVGRVSGLLLPGPPPLAAAADLLHGVVGRAERLELVKVLPAKIGGKHA